MPLEEPIGAGPGRILQGDDAGRPASVADLFEIPVPVIDDAGWERACQTGGSERLPWPTLGNAVFVTGDDPDLESDLFGDFANGRAHVLSLAGRLEEVANLEITERPLAWYSYFFFVPGQERRALYELMGAVRPKPAYRDLAARVAHSLGGFNAAHIRRTDVLVGIPASRRVTPWMIASNLGAVLPTDERLVVCTEAESSSEVFGPLSDAFPDHVFLSDLLLDAPWRDEFLKLPCHDDHALGVVTQEVAGLADRFVGTIGSTFTGAIHRARVLADPTEPFLFVADYTPPGPGFDRCSYLETRTGHFSWNRIGYGMSPDVLAWFREWPEANAELWPSGAGRAL